MKVFKLTKIKLDDLEAYAFIKGVIFNDGSVVINRHTSVSGIIIYDSWDDFKKSHMDDYPYDKIIFEEHTVKWEEWED